jgi:NAD-dependent dihydropyrimidine dehydrogenase PreA subunit
MGMFIRIEVDQDLCAASGCNQCISVCPVDVFRLEKGRLVVDAENEDECTLCDLCLEGCTFHALRIVRVYEEEKP